MEPLSLPKYLSCDDGESYQGPKYRSMSKADQLQKNSKHLLIPTLLGQKKGNFGDNVTTGEKSLLYTNFFQYRLPDK
jgi:hypothetical protein